MPIHLESYSYVHSPLLLVTTVNFSQVGYNFDEDVDEGSGAAQVQLMLSNPSSFETIVHVMTNNYTATGVNNSDCMAGDSENDYLYGLYIVAFPASITMTFVDIPICNDIFLEGDETFSLTIISNSHPDVVKNGSPDHVNITIVDNDGKCCINLRSCQLLSLIDITVNFSSSLYFGRETNGLVQIDLLISNPSSVDIALQVNNQDGGASSEGIVWFCTK